MEGPPNIRGVGAEFYRRGNPLGQAKVQPTDSHTSINQRRQLDDAKLVHPKRRQEGTQTGFEVAQRTTSLHGLGWEHGTVTPAILCEEYTVARPYGDTGPNYQRFTGMYQDSCTHQHTYAHIGSCTHPHIRIGYERRPSTNRTKDYQT